MLSVAHPVVADAVDRSADPVAAGQAVSRLVDARPEVAGRLHDDPGLLAALVAVSAASPHLSRLLVTDPLALDVLSDLTTRPVSARDTAVAVGRWKQLELLRIAGRDLLGLDRLEETGSALSQLADDVLVDSLRIAGLDQGGLAVIAMGKLGGRELNYASDIDIMFVGEGDPRGALQVARRAWRVDVDLRPEGRNGPLTRSLDSYLAYWDRWAETWEFQALIKARAAAGDPELGTAFMGAAQERVWSRPFGADELRAVRAMKVRTEGEVAKKGLSARELKRGPGGIRDVEFAIQLLQLVHGRADPALRSPTTLSALAELAAAGYVAGEDAQALDEAYRFLRAAEHRLQLVEDQQVHALPTDAPGRLRLARVMGYRDDTTATATAYFERDLHRHQAVVRSIHERLFFRPLLEAFTRTPARQREPQLATERDGLTGSAVAERLAAFGFSDAERTRLAVKELTRGFSRSSRLMQQLLPLLFGWLSESPDPDLGLLGLRSLATGQHRRDQLVALFRESPEAARRLCLLLGTSPLFNRAFERQPELLADLAADDSLAARLTRPDLTGEQGSRPALGAGGPRGAVGTGEDRAGEERGAGEESGGEERGGGAAAPARALARFASGPAEVQPGRFVSGDGARTREELRFQASTSLSWRAGPDERRHGLERLVRSEWLRLAAGDVLGLRDVSATERGLSTLAEVVLETALHEVKPSVPFAVVAMGRFGGAELSYASDLDVLFVYDGDQTAEGEATAAALMRYLNGETPATRLWTTDADLRPEGRHGPLARSVAAYQRYHERWARLWERQALLRGRVVAGDADVGRRFQEIVAPFLWSSPLTDDDVREIRRMKARIERERIPAGEDPQFHLKLGRGSLSDVEWTVQLLQLQHHVAAEGTMAALNALLAAGAVDAEDAEVLQAAYHFCEEARNRLFLVRGQPGDALPATGPVLTHLARSLGTSPTELREEYRRRTRRSRQVVERLFYGRSD
ncbi:MAG TPA: putative nucleotidyltransferase substrate binding domain-containing protein [Acidimicrobiales bacterium]|nr:putative nucleotidyltransferase substrate binding domain-containing protein [Acidimicrobiales bacterium]